MADDKEMQYWIKKAKLTKEWEAKHKNLSDKDQFSKAEKFLKKC